MEIIEKVSISGRVFMLEPAAHETLTSYLKKTNEYYSDKESGDEIIEGIEGRVAELLEEKRGVIGKADVNEIIKTMGMPEDMEEPEKPAENETKERSWTKKRLMRDPKNGRIGGVCTGLATYFGIDPVIVRLIFAGAFALTFFSKGGAIMSVPLVYLVLLFCIPAAKTVKDRWSIKGDDGTVENVEKIVKRGEAEVRSVARSDFWKVLGRVMASFAGIIMLTLGVCGIVVGIAGPISAFVSPAVASWWQDFSGNWPQLALGLSSVWVRVCIGIIWIIPFIGLLLGGLQLCFRFKTPKWQPGLILFLIWIAAVVAVMTKLLTICIPYI